MNREELAWAGGFFSGEGCTILHIHKGQKKKYKPYPSVHINHTSVEELIRFDNAIGNLGRITGPKKAHSPLSKKPRYDINCYGFAKTQAVVAMLWPFLSTAKQEQATKVLTLYREHGN